jgi:hypothetical protein
MDTTGRASAGDAGAPVVGVRVVEGAPSRLYVTERRRGHYAVRCVATGTTTALLGRAAALSADLGLVADPSYFAWSSPR